MQTQTELTRKSSYSPASVRPRLLCHAVAPWTREDINQMVEEEELEQEQQLGESWRSFFEDDPQGLFDYADAAQDEWNETLGEVMDMPKTEWEVGPLSAAESESKDIGTESLGWMVQPVLGHAAIFTRMHKAAQNLTGSQGMHACI